MVKNGFFVWILSIVEQLLELQERWVVEPFLDVERKRQMMVILFTYCLIVDLHVVVYGLLVAQVIVVLHLCVCQQIMWSHVLLFFLFLFITFLSFANYSGVLGRAVIYDWICGGWILFFKLWFWAVVAQCRWCKFVFLWSCYQIFLRWCALFISCLSRQLAIDVASSSSWLWASFLVSIYWLLLQVLYLFPRFQTVQYLVWFPLRPYEVVVFPVVKVSHRPPKSRFQRCSHNAGIVSTSNVIFVWRKRCSRKLYFFNAIWL